MSKQLIVSKITTNDLGIGLWESLFKNIGLEIMTKECVHCGETLPLHRDPLLSRSGVAVPAEGCECEALSSIAKKTHVDDSRKG